LTRRLPNDGHHAGENHPVHVPHVVQEVQGGKASPIANRPVLKNSQNSWS
jgi:hypothetical protein